MPKTKVFSTRLPSELLDKIRKQAESEGRSLNNLIVLILTKYFGGKNV